MSIASVAKAKKTPGTPAVEEKSIDGIYCAIEELDMDLAGAQREEEDLTKELAEAQRTTAFIKQKKKDLGLALAKLNVDQIIARQPYDEAIRKALSNVPMSKLQRDGATDDQIESLVNLRGSYQTLTKISDALPAGKKKAAEIRRIFGIPQPKSKPAAKKAEAAKPAKKSGGGSGSGGVPPTKLAVKKAAAPKPAPPELAETAGAATELSKQDRLLMTALHRVEGSVSRWSALAIAGATDAQLREAIGKEWSGYGGHAGSYGSYEVQGGQAPKIWIGRGRWQKPVFAGKALLDRVRTLLSIPQPGDAGKGKTDEGSTKATDLLEVRKADPDDMPDGSRDDPSNQRAGDLRELRAGEVSPGDGPGAKGLADPPADKRGPQGGGQISFYQWFSTFRAVYETEARGNGRKIPAEAQPRDVRIHALWEKYPTMRPADAARKFVKELRAQRDRQESKAIEASTTPAKPKRPSLKKAARQGSPFVTWWTCFKELAREKNLDCEPAAVGDAARELYDAGVLEDMAVDSLMKKFGREAGKPKAKDLNPPAAGMQGMLWSPWWTSFQEAAGRRSIDPRRSDVQNVAKHLFSQGWSPVNAAIEMAGQFSEKPAGKPNGAAKDADPAAIAAGPGGHVRNGLIHIQRAGRRSIMRKKQRTPRMKAGRRANYHTRPRHLVWPQNQRLKHWRGS